MKILKWVLALTALVPLAVVTYWLTEADELIPPTRIAVVSQLEGDSTSIDVPVERFAELPNLMLQARVRNTGRLISETDLVGYTGDANYKFMTPISLKQGRYEAFLVANYQLNPLKDGEIERLMAIIYVEPK